MNTKDLFSDLEKLLQKLRDQLKDENQCKALDTTSFGVCNLIATPTSTTVTYKHPDLGKECSIKGGQYGNETLKVDPVHFSALIPGCIFLDKAKEVVYFFLQNVKNEKRLYTV